MKNKGLVATIVVLIAVIITLIAVLVLMQMTTILSNDGWPSKFLTKKETTIVSTSELPESSVTASTESTKESKKLKTRIENYTAYNNHVSIDYPQLEGMDDEALQNNVNTKIRINATSIVPLYPISTALQDLAISCEVKHLDENTITIIYEGKVVGRKAGNSSNTKSNSSSSSKTTTNKSSTYQDPYLDGFVDPLTTYSQGLGVTAGNNSIPSTSNQSVVSQTTRIETAATTVANNSKPSDTTIKPTERNVNTEDKGPTVHDITAPTAPTSIVSSGNIANNNPTAYSSPISGRSPISGFVNTNASDINQRIYYANTINLKTGLDVKLSDYISDFDELAKYVRSSKVEFVNINDSDRKQVREYVNKTIQSKYVEQMKAADFRNEVLSTWPKIFSYKGEDGAVYFSVKLSSALGNYAIVKYSK